MPPTKPPLPARIVTISDHIDCPTGFGVQHRHVAAALARAGFDVHSLGLWDNRPLATTPEGLTRYPGGQGGDDHRRAWAMYRDLLRPDLVITLGDLDMFAHLTDADRDFAWCHWLPIDAEPYPERDHARLLRCDHLVLMSRFGLELVRPRLEGRVPLHYIPHGVDVRIFQPLEDPLVLRRRWSRRLGVELGPRDFILIARDTNQWRKQTPLLLDALARTPRDVKLLLHCHPVAHPEANGWDLEHLARDVYRVADRVVFTGRGAERPSLSPKELAQLDNLADLRVSATQGEGFGVVTLEAMACGTPTLITDYTTSRELVEGRGSSGEGRGKEGRGARDQGRGSRPLGFPSSLDPRPSTLDPLALDPFGPAGELIRVASWTVEQRRHLLRPVIDTADLAARVAALRADPGRLAAYAAAGLRRVHASYTVGHVARAWVSLARRVLALPPAGSPPAAPLPSRRFPTCGRVNG